MKIIEILFAMYVEKQNIEYRKRNNDFRSIRYNSTFLSFINCGYLSR